MRHVARRALWPLSGVAVLMAAVIWSVPPVEPSPHREAGPPGVILFIGDGAGLSYWSAAKLASDSPLAVQELGTVGLVDTRSFNSRITDSGAAATAYAAGVRTNTTKLGVDSNGRGVPTVLEVAEHRGWSTGLVATSSIVHATPAAFAAHSRERSWYDQIAAQMTEQGIEVLLGGGRRYFDPGTRKDGRDLLARLAGGAAYVEDPESFAALDMDTVRSLIGLFADEHLEPAATRSPSLAQMTRAALVVLEKDPDGFFLMVEGSQIDSRGHENAALEEVVEEVRDLDRAVREALVFQERRSNTLIVVTADHETGGLALHGGGGRRYGANYTTAGHTAGMVPLFARGPHAPAFAGIMDNDRVGRLLLELVRTGRVSAARER